MPDFGTLAVGIKPDPKDGSEIDEDHIAAPREQLSQLEEPSNEETAGVVETPAGTSAAVLQPGDETASSEYASEPDEASTSGASESELL